METVVEICEQLGSDDQPKAYAARRELADRTAAPETDRAVLAAELAAALVARVPEKPEEEKKKKGDKEAGSPIYSQVARNHICRVLGDIGGDAQIAALVEILDDFEVREMARYALDRIPTQAATTALTDALSKTIGVEFRVGVINALGRRHDPAAREALQAAAKDVNDEVRLAAAEALAQQADAAGDKVIIAVGKDLRAANPRAAKRMNIARLQLADTLSAAGQKDAARGIYTSIAADGADEPQQKAAKTALEQLG